VWLGQELGRVLLCTASCFSLYTLRALSHSKQRMPGDARVTRRRWRQACPADDQRRSGLESFSVRKTSLGATLKLGSSDTVG
jgi:hypothetical protein